MKTFVLFIGVVLVAGVVVWSLAVLPDQSKQDKLGAGIGPGIEKGIGKLPITAGSESVDISGQAEPAIPVLLEPPQVKPGHKIKVTVGASDTLSINEVPIYWLMDIYLESSTGLTSAKGSIINIDGEGRRFGHIAIPADAEPGTWKVKTVDITDTEGAVTSYSYGKEIFSTFTVE